MKQRSKLVLLVFALIVIRPNCLPAQVIVKDSLALVALYNNTDGPHWERHDNWLTSKPVKDWYGIYVSPGGRRVVGVYLASNNLSGTLPVELANLKKLEGLDLAYNQLSGSIPKELGDLTELYRLTLHYNELSGSIPKELGNLIKLEYLWLFNNELSGTLPPELGKLIWLDYLYLENNQLSGSIPKELGTLSQLQVLTLNNNQLSGSIPAEIGNLGHLIHLDLSNNELSGSIPKFNLYLYNLFLNNNKLTGNIPHSLKNLTQLVRLGVGNNRLSGTVPSFLGTLPELKSLNILSNHYTFNGLETLVQHNNFNVFKYQRERRIDLHQNGNTFSVYAGGTLSNNTYKWFRNGALTATKKGDSTFKPTQNGSYTVQVTNSIATELTLYSDTISFSTLNAVEQSNMVALQAMERNYFSVYPNPAKATTTIVFNSIGNYSIKITDVSGRVLETKTGVADGKTTMYLDVGRYLAGEYFATLYNNNGKIQTLKLTKQ